MSDKFIHVFLWILGSETTFSQIKPSCWNFPWVISLYSCKHDNDFSIFSCFFLWNI